MNSNIILSKQQGDDYTMLDEKTLNSILDDMCEAFETICEKHEVQVFEEDFEEIKDAITNIRGFGK